MHIYDLTLPEVSRMTLVSMEPGESLRILTYVIAHLHWVHPIQLLSRHYQNFHSPLVPPDIRINQGNKDSMLRHAWPAYTQHHSCSRILPSNVQAHLNVLASRETAPANHS